MSSKSRTPSSSATKKSATALTFWGSDARVEQGDKVLTVFADDDFKLEQVIDVLKTKLSKRNGHPLPGLRQSRKVSGNKVNAGHHRQSGRGRRAGQKLVRLIKDSKLKVQASIQGDAVRVSGAKRDLLQECIAMVRKGSHGFSAAIQ